MICSPNSARRPRPKSATSIAARSSGVSTIPASASIPAARSRAASTSALESTLDRDALAAQSRAVERVECPRLPEGIGPAEQRLALAPDRVAQVLELQLVRVGTLELDPLDATVASNLDHRHVDVERVV